MIAINGELELSHDDGNTTSYKDAWELFQLFCAANYTISDNQQTQKVYSIKNGSLQWYDETTYKAMSFIIQSGAYGIESDMTDRFTQEISHHRNANEADVKEFTCVIYIPKDVEHLSISKGIMVFQSIANYGVKTICCNYMRTFFAQFKITFETHGVSIGAFMQKLIEQGRLYKMKLINNRVSPNPADNMIISTGREEKVYFRPQLTPQWLANMLQLFQRVDENGICEIPYNENYDDISIQFKLGKQSRTVRLRNLERLSIVEDVPDEISERRDIPALTEYMLKTADEYKERMVFTGNGV